MRISSFHDTSCLFLYCLTDLITNLEEHFHLARFLSVFLLGGRAPSMHVVNQVAPAYAKACLYHEPSTAGPAKLNKQSHS